MYSTECICIRHRFHALHVLACFTITIGSELSKETAIYSPIADGKIINGRNPPVKPCAATTASNSAAATKDASQPKPAICCCFATIANGVEASAALINSVVAASAARGPTCGIITVLD
jgi:hypothetical protein